jgi:hypothetical protein
MRALLTGVLIEGYGSNQGVIFVVVGVDCLDTSIQHDLDFRTCRLDQLWL